MIDPFVKISAIEKIPIDDVFEAWYYDNDTPLGETDNGVPVFENDWSMCSTKANGQKSAWGTFGYKNKDILPGIPNTDPLRQDGIPELPSEACELGTYPELDFLTVTAMQYYLPTEIANSIDDADIFATYALNPLHRKIKC